MVFEGQPSTVKIRIPDVPSAGTEGSAAETLWSDFKDMGIVRDAMFTDDPGIPDFGNYDETAEYPISLDDVISMGGEYLGYALLKPVMKTDTETISVELHTDAGVFGVEIDPKTLGINFEAGHIYDIYIDIKTDDSINAVLENSDFMNFKNLAPMMDMISVRVLLSLDISVIIRMSPDCMVFNRRPSFLSFSLLLPLATSTTQRFTVMFFLAANLSISSF